MENNGKGSQEVFEKGVWKQVGAPSSLNPSCPTRVSDNEILWPLIKKILWSTRYEKSVTMPQKVTAAFYGKKTSM